MTQKVGDKNASPDKKKKGMDMFMFIIYLRRDIYMYVYYTPIYLLKST